MKEKSSKPARKTLRKRKCKVCKDVFQPMKPFQGWCTPDCAYKWQRVLRDKAERKKDKELKQSQLTHGDYIQLTQKVFNTFIRLRDRHEPCISCGTRNSVKYDAGHYWAAGNYTYLRFNELNVHKQCSNKCNKHLSGNLTEYRFGLIRKIGEAEVLKLDEQRHMLFKISIPELKEMIIIYKEKIKELNNIIKQEDI